MFKRKAVRKVFKNLRMRLALYNLSVILGLFVVLVVGTYFFMAGRFEKDSSFFRNKLANDLMEGVIDDLPPHHQGDPRLNGAPPPPFSGEQAGMMPHPPIPPNFLGKPDGEEEFRPEIGFIKLNAAGEMIGKSSQLMLSEEKMREIIAVVSKRNSREGSIVLDGNDNEYRYLMTNADSAKESYIILQNFRHERMMLKDLLLSLSVAGVVCMFFSLLGSWFLAGKALVPIQKAWQQQRDFLADVSHELRTPISVIQANLGVLDDCVDDTILSQKHWLENIAEESANMAKLVNSLMFLARADAEQQSLEKVNFSMREILYSVAEAFEILATEKDIRINFRGSDSEVMFCGDEGKIRQLLFILLDNALRHTAEKGVICLELQEDSYEVAVIVEDNGEGIAREHLDRIFDRFYQVDDARAKGGSGLGLSIAKWIVSSHGGNMKVMSTLGFGTIFKVTLPKKCK